MNYKFSCKVCQAKGIEAFYLGESGHSGYFRAKFHVNALQNKYKDSVLYKHCIASHPGMSLTADDFTMEIVSVDRRNIVRQCREGVTIEKALVAVRQGPRLELLNSKSKFLQPGTVTRQFSRVLG